jgi:hypothetical protein
MFSEALVQSHPSPLGGPVSYMLLLLCQHRLGQRIT